MKPNPIIFSAPMVRALLEGRKTQTRCYARAATERAPYNATWAPDSGFKKTRRVGQVWSLHSPYLVGSRLLHGTARCPYKPGDLLWVREELERARGEVVGYPSDCAWLPNTPWTWKKNILQAPFMPRWASRLTLRVTNIRAERLQDISREDAISEGASMRPACNGCMSRYDGWSMDWSRVGAPSKFGVNGTLTEQCISLGDPQGAFLSYWTDLYGEHETKSVGANPWVWVYGFEVIQQNVDAVMASNE